MGEYLTKHAEVRSNQRGISTNVIELILLHGISVNKPGNATECYIPNRKINELIHRHKQEIHRLEKAANKGIVLAEDDAIITVYQKKGK